MIAPEPFRTQVAKYLRECFHDEHGPSFWEGYTGHADDLWCMLRDAADAAVKAEPTP